MVVEVLGGILGHFGAAVSIKDRVEADGGHAAGGVGQLWKGARLVLHGHAAAVASKVAGFLCDAARRRRYGGWHDRDWRHVGALEQYVQRPVRV